MSSLPPPGKHKRKVRKRDVTTASWARDADDGGAEMAPSLFEDLGG